MKSKRNFIQICLLCAITLPAVMQAQFTFTTNNGAITITGGTTFSGGAIPATINGLPVTAIANNAFSGNTAIVGSVSLSTNISSIGNAAFVGCDYMTTITVDAQNAFYSSAGGVLFNKAQTTLIDYPGGKAGSYTIPSSVTVIGNVAFATCANVTGVYIPSSVTNVQPYTFQSCPKLAAITVDPLNPDYSSLGGVLFDKNQTLLLQFPTGLGGSYSISNSIVSIAPGAFMMCGGIQNRITLPSSVTNIGAYAFWGSSFASVTIPGSVTSFGTNSFKSLASFTALFFGGNAPTNTVASMLDLHRPVYYLPGTIGWGTTFGGSGYLRLILWNPQARTTDGYFGVLAGQFGFNITGTANIPILVEACTNLTNPTWQSLQTFTVTNGSIYFSDSQWTNYPGRFYRIRSP
jgi:hypothetical protein